MPDYVQVLYVQKGDALDYTNTSDDPIPEGAIIQLPAGIGITGCEIAPGETGSLHVTGTFGLPKGETAVPIGTLLSWDGAKVTASSAHPIGIAAASAAASDPSIPVRIAPPSQTGTSTG